MKEEIVPNHVRNAVSVVGSEGRVALFIEAAKGKKPVTGDPKGHFNHVNPDERKEQAFSFHSLAPLPEEYSERPYSEDGYNMEVRTWGVKWGAYDQAEPLRRDGRVTYRFTTAWSPPLLVLEKASRAWPDLKFFISWGGEGPTRGRALLEDGDSTVLDNGDYREGDWPNYDDFSDEDDYHSAYETAEGRYLNTHESWVQGG